MGFEKQILNVAEECGIDDAYFYEGTMFFSPDNVTVGMVDKFRRIVEDSFVLARIQVHDAGDEVAVDFV